MLLNMKISSNFQLFLSHLISKTNRSSAFGKIFGGHFHRLRLLKNVKKFR